MGLTGLLVGLACAGILIRWYSWIAIVVGVACGFAFAIGAMGFAIFSDSLDEGWTKKR